MVPGGPLGGGFVLDGFPRTLHQARELDRVHRRLPAAPRHRSRRPAGDRVRPHRGPARVRELPARVPREPAADARTGCATRAAANVRQRDDDTEDAVERRLELYERETVPIVDYYRALGLLTIVDGVGEGDEVFERLVKVCAEQLVVAGSPPMVLRKTAAQIALMRRAGSVVAEMHEACTRAAVPGATTADLDARGPRGARPPQRPLELPRLPRVPGGGVRLAERGDRARHPRRPGARGRATSSRSTAGRSSRAGTPTPRSRSRSGEVDAESQRLMDVTRAALESAIAATVAGNRLGDIGAAAERRGHGRRVRRRARVRRARHRHGHARGARGPELRARRAGA